MDDQIPLFDPIVVAMTTTMELNDGSWDLRISVRLEGSRAWTTEVYEGLSLGELLDVIQVVAVTGREY